MVGIGGGGMTVLGNKSPSLQAPTNVQAGLSNNMGGGGGGLMTNSMVMPIANNQQSINMQGKETDWPYRCY